MAELPCFLSIPGLAGRVDCSDDLRLLLLEFWLAGGHFASDEGLLLSVSRSVSSESPQAGDSVTPGARRVHDRAVLSQSL